MLNLYKIRQIGRKARWFIQRGRRGFADCDVWNLDSYLTEVIINSLTQFRESTTFTHLGNFETGEAWAAVIEEIIEGFKTHQKIENMEYVTDAGRDEVLMAEWQREREHAMDLLKEYWGDFWN